MNITSRINEQSIDGIHVLAARSGVTDLVVVKGSVLGGWSMLAYDKCLVPGFATALLDAGTKKRDMRRFREDLSSRGIALSFSSSGDRIHFKGTCLPEHLSYLLAAIAECLSMPSFPAAEVRKEVERGVARLEQEKTETRVQADRALRSMLYPKEHANGSVPDDERLQLLKAIRRTDLVSFMSRVGKQGMTIAVVGDVQCDQVPSLVAKVFSTLPQGSYAIPEKTRNTKKAAARKAFMQISDKTTIDVVMGMSVPLTYEHPLFLPFVVLMSMLGGSGLTTGHLSRTIRERDGYTYGIYAQPTGFAEGHDGMFRVTATFSPSMYDKAVAATLKEMKTFFTTGLTDKALAEKKEEMLGAYAMAFSTSSAIASNLVSNAHEGKPLSYLDEYPEILSNVSLAEVKAAAKLIDLSKLSLAAAGTKRV